MPKYKMTLEQTVKMEIHVQGDDIQDAYENYWEGNYEIIKEDKIENDCWEFDCFMDEIEEIEDV